MACARARSPFEARKEPLATRTIAPPPLSSYGEMELFSSSSRRGRQTANGSHFVTASIPERASGGNRAKNRAKLAVVETVRESGGTWSETKAASVTKPFRYTICAVKKEETLACVIAGAE